MYVSVWYYYCFVAEEREIVVLRERVGVVWERKSKSKEKRSCLCFNVWCSLSFLVEIYSGCLLEIDSYLC